ncbi:ComEC/Rec2 family competence protein [Actinacidiphila epipremni]|uniref:MBL fold metallo-hydrolase n=1 Tax=Actinacidiphila epipremni TaxID=2053013 RepID=A0ABX0ZFN1_9ACTN|nr:ComEC/Rec2 family competence protein [Actinacidiphila epipremni]NJP42111.1 MBL fold metallo-hydrolase [Actinacidiphila epipremni]
MAQAAGPGRNPVHAKAASRLGASNPRQDGPPDLRLVPPALAAWAAAALTPAVGATVLLLATAAAAAALTATFALTRTRRRKPKPIHAGPAPGPASSPATAPATGLAVTAAATLLTVAAATLAAALADADRHRGPIPRLAAHRATVELDLRITSDPTLTRSRAPAPAWKASTEAARAEPAEPAAPAGNDAAPGMVIVPAEALQLGKEKIRTPVLVLADADLPTWQHLLPSTTLRLTARLAPADRPGDSVAAVLRPTGAPRVIGPPSTAQRVAARFRSGLRTASAGLPPDARGLLPGLVTGDTAGLESDLKDAFRATDLAHLTSVSGANLTIVLLLLIGPPAEAIRAERRGLAGALGIPLRITAVLGAALTGAFVLVCRPGPSVVRAAACGLITLLAIATGRRRSLLPALAGAVLLLVLYDPPVARSYGFALSVLATGSLLTLAPRWSAALRARRVPARLAEALAAAGAAQAACGPLIVVLSARLSLVGVPCNLLAEPAVAPATVLGFCALAVAPLTPAAAAALAWAAGWPTRWIVTVARHGAALPWAEIGWPAGWAGAALLTTLTVALAAGGARALGVLVVRPWAVCAAALLLLLALVRPLPLPLPGGVTARWPPAQWRFAMCDVGQGDALALSAGPGSAVVVDTGPDPELADRCLRRLRVTAIPLLVLTHFHADHADGLPGVLHGRRVGAIETTVLDEPAGEAARVRREAAAAGVPLLRASVGEERTVGPLSWRVLWPPPTADALPDDDPNDASVAMLVRTGSLTLLLAGDLGPAAQEEILAADPGLPRVDVLKVAHHGSAYQSPAFLARLHPRLALVSVGLHNSYGHPSPRTLTALRALGATVLRTDTSGSLALTTTAPTPPAGPPTLHTSLTGPQ